MLLPAGEEDTRKVQTAVAGSPAADHPVYLPMDAAEYDRFIREYPAREFYCGTLLGGCGKKLAARKYRDKKCHFAHVAAGACRRASTNEASADHLYMGRAITVWLKEQKYGHVQPRYKQKGKQDLRDFVDIRYMHREERRERLVRVQLARRSKSEWEETDTRLREQWTGIEWLFGPDSMLANWQIDRRGYALRIRCRPAGITRVVEVGVQLPDTPIDWVPLTECRMTAHGIRLPGLEPTADGLVPLGRQAPSPASRSIPTPAAAGRRTDRSGEHRPLETPSPSAALPGGDEPNRRAAAPADPQPHPEKTGVFTTSETAPGSGEGAEGTPRTPPARVPLQEIQAYHDEKATEEMTLLLDHLDLVGDELHLDQLQTVLRGISALERTMWRGPAPEVRKRVRAWQAHADMLLARPTFREICAHADAVRPLLSVAARTARPLTWTELGTRLDGRLPALHPDDKVAVLVETDRATSPDRPLLSALVAARGHRVHPLYARVLDHLDRAVPRPSDAQAAWEEDLRRHRASPDLQYAIRRVHASDI
ncbi:competence protein CoiA family protein [Streptomyces sp. NPDC051041]|uniref:competence protein CoiA family protein n=1 Tax=Streptomyces sp. NPDC051041 TaxID=3365640 RepID=UPI0037991E2F